MGRRTNDPCMTDGRAWMLRSSVPHAHTVDANTTHQVVRVVRVRDVLALEALDVRSVVVELPVLHAIFLQLFDRGVDVLGQHGFDLLQLTVLFRNHLGRVRVRQSKPPAHFQHFRCNEGRKMCVAQLTPCGFPRNAKARNVIAHTHLPPTTVPSWTRTCACPTPPPPC